MRLFLAGFWFHNDVSFAQRKNWSLPHRDARLPPPKLGNGNLFNSEVTPNSNLIKFTQFRQTKLVPPRVKFHQSPTIQESTKQSFLLCGKRENPFSKLFKNSSPNPSGPVPPVGRRILPTESPKLSTSSPQRCLAGWKAICCCSSYYWRRGGDNQRLAGSSQRQNMWASRRKTFDS